MNRLIQFHGATNSKIGFSNSLMELRAPHQNPQAPSGLAR